MTPKQEKFCQKYLELGNASEAYRQVYSCRRMKEKQVWEEASKLLKNPKVTQRIKGLQEEMRKRSDVTKEEVLRMLRGIMYADIRQFLTIKEGSVQWKDSTEWTDEMAMQVESVKQGKDGLELRLNSRTWSIQRICKMLGFDAPQEIKIDACKPMTMDEAKKIVEEI